MSAKLTTVDDHYLNIDHTLVVGEVGVCRVVFPSCDALQQPLPFLSPCEEESRDRDCLMSPEIGILSDGLFAVRLALQHHKKHREMKKIVMRQGSLQMKDPQLERELAERRWV